MRLRPLLLLCLLSLVAGCNGGEGGSGDLAGKLIAGDFGGVVESAKASGADSVPDRFAVAVAKYFLDDYDALTGAREAALGTAINRAAVAAWIREHAGDGSASPVAAFLRGVASEIDNDHVSAANWYHKAAAADATRPQYGWCAVAVDPEATYAAVIPETNMLTYEGTLRLVGSGAWLPVDDDFKVTGGVAITSLGDVTMEATFGDWVLLESPTPGATVGWASLLVDGAILLPPKSEFGPAGEDIDMFAKATYTSSPFDFFGRYRVVHLDNDTDRFPMIRVPYVLRGRRWLARGFLAEQVRLGLGDANAFIQVAFFPIEVPLNVHPNVSYPERGLDFTYFLNEVPGEFRFKEKAQMYRLPAEPPNEIVTVTNEDDRLIWLGNTALGRKKVWEAWIHGPLRTFPVLRAADIPDAPPVTGSGDMADPRFIPLPGYEAYTVEEMRRRAADFADFIGRRRTVRHFSDRAVPRDVIDDCIRAAGTAPSGAHRQPWHFVVITDPDVKHRIRDAAEREEHEFYTRRAPAEWLEALAPLGTDENKPFLETAPYLIAIFQKKYDLAPDGKKIQNYYAPESVGIATGLLIAAVHNAGLASLTHTPSPMGFLNEILDRPPNEKAYLILVVGYPTDDATVPVLERKPVGEIRSEV